MNKMYYLYEKIVINKNYTKNKVEQFWNALFNLSYKEDKINVIDIYIELLKK